MLKSQRIFLNDVSIESAPQSHNMSYNTNMPRRNDGNHSSFFRELKKVKEKFDQDDYMRLHDGIKSDPDYGAALLEKLLSISSQ